MVLSFIWEKTLQIKCVQQPGEICILWLRFLVNFSLKKLSQGLGNNQTSLTARQSRINLVPAAVSLQRC